MSAHLTFAVSTFDRVFETAATPDVLTLGELIQALTRFELRDRAWARVRRERARLESALNAVLAGREQPGKRWSKIAEAFEAGGAGAAREAMEHLVDIARKDVKRELRIWSPALYAAGAKRGKENVQHLSCLVLDYDDGTTISEASTCWSAFFHIAHTTWSHTHERHKFRLILPLAQPARVEDWERIWQWAQQRAGGHLDPAPSGIAANFALPAIPTRGWPKQAFTREGALLDPVVEGLASAPAKAVVLAGRPERSLMRHGEPDAVYLEHKQVAPEDPFDEDLWDQLDAVGTAATPAQAAAAPAPQRPEPTQPPPVTSLEERVAQLEAQVAQLLAERGAGLVDRLERLAVLRDEGVLDDEEFEQAKALELMP